MIFFVFVFVWYTVKYNYLEESFPGARPSSGITGWPSQINTLGEFLLGEFMFSGSICWTTEVN